MTGNEYHPSCERTQILEVCPAPSYPLGYTKSVSLYQNPLGREEIKALYLACGDPRSAIATAAEAGKDSKLKLLQLNLNDPMPELVARAGLLLLMSSELDADSKDDMELLWAVWCCVSLFPEQATRLTDFLQRLLRRDFGDRLQMEVGAGGHEVEKIWQAWAGAYAAPTFPSAAEACRRRCRWMGKLISISHQGMGFRQRAETCASGDAAKIMPLNEKSKELEHELQRWYETGSAHPRETTDNMVANPTLLQPGTWAWQVCYTSSPFVDCRPLEPTDSLSGSTKQVLEMSLSKLTARVRGFCRCCKRKRIEVKLWATDPMALCDHVLSESARFDIIDTTYLADDVELLNVILMAVPRLESHPAARLYSHTTLWKDSLQSYLDSALGIPDQMYPTLLGVRLLNDLSRGTVPYTNHDRLEWIAVPAIKHTPHATGSEGCDIMEGLKALAMRCCRQKMKHLASAYNVLHFPEGCQPGVRLVHGHLALTPLSLALAVISAASRVSGIIDTKKSWSENASALHRALGLPESNRAEWETWMCWLLADKLTGQIGKPSS